MKKPPFLLALALSAFAAPAVAQEVEPPAETPASEAELDLEQTMAMRCSIAFARVADWQSAGDEEALAYPDMNERGREFFVRTMVGIMEDTGMTRDELLPLVEREVSALTFAINERNTVDAMMPACLMALDASGL